MRRKSEPTYATWVDAESVNKLTNLEETMYRMAAGAQVNSFQSISRAVHILLCSL